ncbi:DNA methyltransferase [Xenorhabdus sp. TH1]|uniref:DNA methyltransferase n=1 Tax=Xenorhabdus sp. TH1 TaxID=3130166 RepID=UPI0030D2FB86
MTNCGRYTANASPVYDHCCHALYRCLAICTGTLLSGQPSCEKPIDLMAHIIQSSSREGDLVVDFFMGSGQR